MPVLRFYIIIIIIIIITITLMMIMIEKRQNAAARDRCDGLKIDEYALVLRGLSVDSEAGFLEGLNPRAFYLRVLLGRLAKWSKKH